MIDPVRIPGIEWHPANDPRDGLEVLLLAKFRGGDVLRLFIARHFGTYQMPVAFDDVGETVHLERLDEINVCLPCGWYEKTSGQYWERIDKDYVPLLWAPLPEIPHGGDRQPLFYKRFL